VLRTPLQTGKRGARWLEVVKRWARALKKETYALYLASRDPRVPWYARLLAVCVVGYAFSPIDLIPDTIPLLGYLDDLLLVPVGIWLVLKMMPKEVVADCRLEAERALAAGRPVSWGAAVAIVAIWLLLAAATIALVVGAVR